MTRPGLRAILPSLVFCCYLAAVLAVIFGLVDLNANRYGSMNISLVTVEQAAPAGQSLLLTGRGFVDGMRAVVVPEPLTDDHQYFLDGQLSQGLWTDGHFLLCSYKRNLLLSMQVAEDGSLQVLGSLELPGRIKQLIKVKGRALVSLWLGKFCLVNLSDPAKPELIETLIPESSTIASVKDMVTDGQRVYIPSKQGQLIIVDMTRQKPTATCLATGGRPWRATLYGNRLVTGSLDGEVVLYVLDAEGMPKPVGHFAFASDVRGIELNAYGLFIALGNGELHSFDTRSWPRPEARSVLALEGNLLNLSGTEGRPLLLFSRASRGLLTVDVSSLSNPVKGREFTQIPTVWDFCFADDKVYFVSRDSLGSFPLKRILVGSDDQRVALDAFDYVIYNWDGDLFMLHTGDKSSAREGAETISRSLRAVSGMHGEAPPDWPVRSMGDLDGEDCLAAFDKRNNSGLFLFCRDPAGGTPRLTALLDFSQPTVAFWKRGKIYVLNRNDTSIVNEQTGILRVLDALDPRHPVVTGELILPGVPVALAWLEPHFVLVAAGAAGLYVVDVNDPVHPELAAHLPLPGHLREISRVVNVMSAGPMAFLAHERSGVSMVNLTDPRHPFIERMVDTPGYAKQMAMQGDLLLVSLYNEGIFLIDIDREGWAPVGVVETPVNALDLAVWHDKVFISGGPAGLVRINMPRSLKVQRQDSHSARVVLPGDLGPGTYRLYVYNDTESIRLDSAFQLDTGSTGVAQNE